MAQAIAQGAPVFGHATRQGPVVYLCLEDGARRVLKRLRKQQAPPVLPITYHTTLPPLETAAGAGELIEILATHPRLVVIDTLAAAKTGRTDENSAGPMGDLANALRRLAQHFKTSILVSHPHSSKGDGITGDPSADLRGSSAIAAAADMILGLYRHEGGEYSLKGEGRDLEAFDLRSHFDALDTWAWQRVGDSRALARDEAESQVLDAFCVLGEADPALILRVAGLTPDPWQARVARSRSKRLLLNCTRSGGKSTSVATRALHHALFRKKALVLILCPTQRQSAEFLRRVMDCYNALGRPSAAVYESVHKLELANGSRIICLPGKEANIRAFQGVTLLIIDEAARVQDDLYRSVRPMPAASQGELVCLSTPWGQRGLFWKAWHDKESEWERIEVKADQCPRITPQFLAEEEREMGKTWVLQEYFCSFQSMKGLVYADFDARSSSTDPSGRR